MLTAYQCRGIALQVVGQLFNCPGGVRKLLKRLIQIDGERRIGIERRLKLYQCGASVLQCRVEFFGTLVKTGGHRVDLFIDVLHRGSHRRQSLVEIG